VWARVCAIICGQQFGAGQTERLGTSVHTAMTLSLVGGIGLSLLGLVFVQPMLELMGTPAALMDEALDFSRVYFGAFVFSLVFNMGSAVQRAVGDTRSPSLIVAVTCLINVVCDVISSYSCTSRHSGQASPRPSRSSREPPSPSGASREWMAHGALTFDVWASTPTRAR